MQSRQALVLILTIVILTSTFISTGPLTRSLLPSAQATHVSKPLLGVWNEQYQTHIVNNTGILPGTPITFSVNLTEVVAMNGYDVKLKFSAQTLRALTITTSGNIFQGKDPFNLIICGSSETPLCEDGEGRVNVAQTIIGDTVSGNGFLFKVTFNIEKVGFSRLELSDDRLLIGIDLIDHDTQNGLFTNTPLKPPVASFTYRVDCALSKCAPGQNISLPIQGQTVIFDGSTSFDQNSRGNITDYTWEFSSEETSQRAVIRNSTRPDNPIIRYTFSSAGVLAFGNFTVTLKVKNDPGIEDTDSRDLEVLERLFHDVVARGVEVSPSNVAAGAKVTVTVKVLNQGTSPQNVSVRIFRFFDQIGEEAALINRKTDHDFQFILNTTGLQPALYQIEAKAIIVSSLNVDENPSDNTALGFFEVRLPLPRVAGIAYVGVGALLALVAPILYGIFKSRRKPVE